MERPAEPAWRWGLGCVASAATLLVSVGLVIGTAYAAAMHGGSADQAAALGELTGICILPIALGSVLTALAWAWRRGAGVVSSAGVIGLALLFVLAIGIPALMRRPARELSPEEQAPPSLETRADGRWAIWERDGLELALPDGFEPVPGAPLFRSQLDLHPELEASMIGWQWDGPDGQVVVTLSVHDATLDLDALFAATLRGSRAALSASGTTITEEESLGPLDHLFRVRDESSIARIQRLLAYRRGDTSWIATIIVGSPTPGLPDRVALSAHARP
jgi:hypothetical protein